MNKLKESTFARRAPLALLRDRDCEPWQSWLHCLWCRASPPWPFSSRGGCAARMACKRVICGGIPWFTLGLATNVVWDAQMLTNCDKIISNQVRSTWYQVLGTRYQVPGTRRHQEVPGGTEYLASGTWYQVSGAGNRYPVPTWYQVLGTRCLVPGTWYPPGVGLPPGQAWVHCRAQVHR